MRRVYATVLRLYPPEYRALFESEMLAVLEEACHGPAREIAGLACGAAFEWLAKYRRPRRYLDFAPSGEDRLQFFIKRMEYAIAHHQFAKARYYAEEERQERERLQKRPD